MHSCHSTPRYSPRNWSGLEQSKQKSMRNTGTAVRSTYALFLHCRMAIESVTSVARGKVNILRRSGGGGRHTSNESHPNSGSGEHMGFTLAEPHISKALRSDARFSRTCPHTRN